MFISDTWYSFLGGFKMKRSLRNLLTGGLCLAFSVIFASSICSPLTAHALTPLNANNFDYTKYADMNSDLQAAFGYDPTLLWAHYQNNGVFEGRKAYTTTGDEGYLLTKETFDFVRYADEYVDLKAIFGYNKDQLWAHFVNSGQYEGRRANATTDEIGIDVSSFQGNIDWNAVKAAGINYAVIRLGLRGSETARLVTDSYFHSNIKSAQAAGIRVGVYFVTQAINEAEAREEANYCLAVLKNYNLQLPVFLDVEGSHGGRGDKIDRATRTVVCNAFCSQMTAAGRTAGVYSSLNWFRNNIDMNQLTQYSIWNAQYAEQREWNQTRVDMWQFTSSGAVPGIAGRVDMNRIYVKW